MSTLPNKASKIWSGKPVVATSQVTRAGSSSAPPTAATAMAVVVVVAFFLWPFLASGASGGGARSPARGGYVA